MMNIKDNEKLSYRMRDSQMKMCPYTLIIGDKEMNQKLVSFRLHGEKETKSVSINELLSIIKK